MINDILKLLLFVGGIYFISSAYSNETDDGYGGVRDILSRYDDELTDEEKAKLLDIARSVSPDKPSRYLEHIIKFYLAGKDDPDIYEKIREYLSAFHFYKERHIITGDEADIYRYNTLQEVMDVVEEARRKETRSMLRLKKKKGIGLIEGKDYIHIYSDELVDIYEILTYPASCYFGQGTRWCISMENESIHWRHYKEKENADIFFIIDKEGNKKWAVIIYKENITLPLKKEAVEKAIGEPIKSIVFYSYIISIDKEKRNKLKQIAIENIYLDLIISSRDIIEVYNKNDRLLKTLPKEIKQYITYIIRYKLPTYIQEAKIVIIP